MTRKEILDSLDELIASRNVKGPHDFEELVFQVGINRPESHAEWALTTAFCILSLDFYGGVRSSNQWLGRSLHRQETKDIISDWADVYKNSLHPSPSYEFVLGSLRDANTDRNRDLWTSRLGGLCLLNLENPEVVKVIAPTEPVRGKALDHIIYDEFPEPIENATPKEDLVKPATNYYQTRPNRL